MDIELLYWAINDIKSFLLDWINDEKMVQGLTKLMNSDQIAGRVKDRIQLLIKNLPSFLRAMEDKGFVKCTRINTPNYRRIY